MSLFDMDDHRDTGEIDMSEHEEEEQSWITQVDKRDHYSAESFKERQLGYMTAALLWTLLLAVLAVIGAFAYKLVVFVV